MPSITCDNCLLEFQNLFKHDDFGCKSSFDWGLKLLRWHPTFNISLLPFMFPFPIFFCPCNRLLLNILHTHLHQTLRNFVIINNILTCFKHHIVEASTFKNLEKPQRLIINDGANVDAMVVKLLPSFFTNYAIT
jgi:hypothetical protein